jgi:ELWxxDGT repeat protein
MTLRTLFSVILSLSIFLQPTLGGSPLFQNQLSPVPQTSPTPAADETGAQPVQLSQINRHVSMSSDIRYLQEYLDSVVYVIEKEDGTSELWITDGTPQGTRLLKTGLPGYIYVPDNALTSSVVDQGVLYFLFIAVNRVVHFWRTDGTSQGTSELGVWGTSGPSVSPISIVTQGHGPIFLANQKLWHWDGVSVQQLTDLTTTVVETQLTLFSGEVYFQAAQINNASMFPPTIQGLWKTDGTLEHTQPVFESDDGFVTAEPQLAKEGRLYFVGEKEQGETHQKGLWATDGTAAGTVFLNGAAGFDGAVVEQATLAGEQLVLYSIDSDNRYKLWQTVGVGEDGQLEGITQRADLGVNPYPNSNKTIYQPVGMVNGFFTYLFSIPTIATIHLWSISETGEQFDLGMAERKFAPLGNQLYFSSSDETHGSEVFVTAGTPETTHVAFDLAEGGRSSNPGEIARCGERICFPADDWVYGVEMWSSAGDRASTTLLKDANTTPYVDTSVYPIVDAGSIAYFKAYFGSTYGKELWRTDGTPQGTFSLLGTYPTDGASAADIRNFVVIKDRTYFQVGHWYESSYYTDEYDLWVTRGTPETTLPITGIFPEYQDHNPTPLGVLGDRLLVTSEDTNENETLWLMDEENHLTPVMIGDMNGSTAFLPTVIPFGDGVIFFTGEESDYSYSNIEAWYTDGTPENTRFISSLGFGKVVDWKKLGNQVYFMTWDRVWRTDGTAAGTQEITIPSELNDYSVGSMTVYAMIPSGQKMYFLTAETDYRVKPDFKEYQKLYVVTNQEKEATLVNEFADRARMFYTRAAINGGVVFAGEQWVYYPSESRGIYSATFWTSDGTSAGTRELTTLDGGIAAFLPVGTALYFIHFNQPPDGETGPAVLWKWDSSTGDMAPVEDTANLSLLLVDNYNTGTIFDPDLVWFHGALLFSAQHSASGADLWSYSIPETPDQPTDPQEDDHYLYLPLVIRGK